MATTLPAMSMSGPPLLPELMEASVWTRLSIRNRSDSIVRFIALTTPEVTLGPPIKPNGLPLA